MIVTEKMEAPDLLEMMERARKYFNNPHMYIENRLSVIRCELDAFRYYYNDVKGKMSEVNENVFKNAITAKEKQYEALLKRYNERVDALANGRKGLPEVKWRALTEEEIAEAKRGGYYDDCDSDT